MRSRDQRRVADANHATTEATIELHTENDGRQRIGPVFSVADRLQASDPQVKFNVRWIGISSCTHDCWRHDLRPRPGVICDATVPLSKIYTLAYAPPSSAIADLVSCQTNPRRGGDRNAPFPPDSAYWKPRVCSSARRSASRSCIVSAICPSRARDVHDQSCNATTNVQLPGDP